MAVPFFRVKLPAGAFSEVHAVLESGWLTTGARVRAFQEAFAKYVGAKHAIAVNSCTAALHLALEAVGVRRGDCVLVPTMTFAATAEVVRYFDAVPIFVDCDPETLCIDAARVREAAQAVLEGRPVSGMKPPYGPLKAVIPMHYGGQPCDIAGIAAAATEFGMAVIEDAAHCLPARVNGGQGSGPAAGDGTGTGKGEGTETDGPAGTAALPGTGRHVGTFGRVGCFSFYANKCITTGEGGMAVTDEDGLAKRMRVMTLHGIDRDAYDRFSTRGSWAYEIVAPGFKYNMTDIAAAIGLHHLRQAGELRDARERVAAAYDARLGRLPAIQLPARRPDCLHSWHLYVIRLHPDRWRIDRNRFTELLKEKEIGCSVHYKPLHLMPYYRQTYGLGEGLMPAAEREWPRLISLPIFPDQTGAEMDEVCGAIEDIARQHAR